MSVCRSEKQVERQSAYIQTCWVVRYAGKHGVAELADAKVIVDQPLPNAAALGRPMKSV
jgi:hypothetical protein